MHKEILTLENSTNSNFSKLNVDKYPVPLKAFEFDKLNWFAKFAYVKISNFWSLQPTI